MSNSRTLLEMLTYARPMGSKSERRFRNRYLMNLPGAYKDVYGNIHVAVGDGRCLYSSHTDTVHFQQGRQEIVVADNIVGLPQHSKSNCLGADDTVGVYLMREMILAGCPGVYTFHYGEERGGIGSSAIATHHGPFLTENYDMAIAFDRRGTSDIITHMCVGRTCSDRFARSLADALSGGSLNYRPSSQGSFTDTAEYCRLIPECTNVSVGYAHEHSRYETVDLAHVERLRQALLSLDTTTLVIDRDPSDYREEPRYGFGSHGSLYLWDDYAEVAQDANDTPPNWLKDEEDEQKILADYYKKLSLMDR